MTDKALQIQCNALVYISGCLVTVKQRRLKVQAPKGYKFDGQNLLRDHLCSIHRIRMQLKQGLE